VTAMRSIAFLCAIEPAFGRGAGLIRWNHQSELRTFGLSVTCQKQCDI
jgi:hypothetical protein